MSTLTECVRPLLLEKADEETLKEMLTISFYGKDYLTLTSSEDKEFFKYKALNKLRERLGFRKASKEDIVNQIIKNMEDAITEGVGFFDIFRDMDKYARQLQECLTVVSQALKKKAKEIGNNEWLKEIEKVEAKYSNIYNYSCYTALKLEEDIISLLIDAYIRTLPEDEKEKLLKEIEKIVKNLGVNNLPKGQISLVLAQGGLIALKSLLGFQFHIILAIVVNAIWNITGRILVGKGLSLAVNAAIQRIAAIALGPIGWVITVVLTLPLVTKLLNPREFDKYIPLIVYIYIIRHKDEFEPKAKVRKKK
jgi:uncharacterized protein YaaW (UPF0174 family)